MSYPIQEAYSAATLPVNAATIVRCKNIAGFLCATAGTFTVTRKNGTVVINAFPVSAGVYYPMPFALSNNVDLEHTFTTAGGASGIAALW